MMWLGVTERRRLQLSTHEAINTSSLLDFLKRSSQNLNVCSTSYKSDAWMNPTTPRKRTHCKERGRDKGCG